MSIPMPRRICSRVTRQGGGALYINCGDGQYYRAVASNQKLEVRPRKEGGWASLFIAWEGDRSTVIDGQLFRPNLLPFMSGAPDDFLIDHDGTHYSLPFGNCKTLGLNTPLYGFDHPPSSASKSGEDVKELKLELSEAKFPIESQSQETYVFGRLQSADLNLDGAADAVLSYEDRLGSGCERYAALLLNCGDDRYALSGTVSLGQGDGSHLALQAEKKSICGTPFTTLVVPRSGELDAMRPNFRPPTHYELYLYRPNLKDFLSIAVDMKPFPPKFDPANQEQCANMLKEALKKP